MEEWVARAVGRAHRAECCICGMGVYKHEPGVGAAQRKGGKPVFWHERCYCKRFGKEPEQYAEMARAELQTELDPEQQEKLDALRKEKGMAKTESVWALVFDDGKVYRERRDGYKTASEHVFACKTTHKKLKGKTSAWECIERDSGLRVGGTFGTLKEAKASITLEVVEKLCKERRQSGFKAAVRLNEIVYARGSVTVAEFNELKTKLKDEEFEKFKATRKEQERMEKLNLKGETVCITGTLATMTRSEAFTKLKLVGGIPAERFTSEVTVFVIAGNAGKAKRDKAERAIAKGQQVRIVSGTEFEAALAEAFKRPVSAPPKPERPKVEAPKAPEPPKEMAEVHDEKEEASVKTQIEELEAKLKSVEAELKGWKTKAGEYYAEAQGWKEKAQGEPKVQDAAAVVSLEALLEEAREWCAKHPNTSANRAPGKKAPVRIAGIGREDVTLQKELEAMGYRWAAKPKVWMYDIWAAENKRGLTVIDGR